MQRFGKLLGIWNAKRLAGITTASLFYFTNIGFAIGNYWLSKPVIIQIPLK